MKVTFESYSVRLSLELPDGADNAVKVMTALEATIVLASQAWDYKVKKDMAEEAAKLAGLGTVGVVMAHEVMSKGAK